MGDKIDMSLDDIIKKEGIGRRGRGRGKARVGAGGSSGQKRSPGAGVNQRSLGIQKRSLRTGGSMNMRSRQPFTRGIRDSGASGRWEHDMFESKIGSGGGLGGAHLLVSNLDFGVSDADIEELFMDFASLRRASIHYDKSGRSLGTADVIYDRRADAMRAMQQYNGVPLDANPRFTSRHQPDDDEKHKQFEVTTDYELQLRSQRDPQLLLLKLRVKNE